MRVLLVERLQRSHGLRLGRNSDGAVCHPLQAAADSLVAEYLQFSKLPYSLAVFQPESGLAAPLGSMELATLLPGLPGAALERARGDTQTAAGALLTLVFFVPPIITTRWRSRWVMSVFWAGLCSQHV